MCVRAGSVTHLRNYAHWSAFKCWLRGPATSIPRQTNVLGVTAATNFSSDLGHEDREVCKSQRGEGSLSAFRRGRDGHYVDRVFAFANSVLTALLKQQSRRRYAANGFALLPHTYRLLGRQRWAVERAVKSVGCLHHRPRSPTQAGTTQSDRRRIAPAQLRSSAK
jgi:hypothetical protein